MNKDVNKDLRRSHVILNQLASEYQGKFAYLNIIQQLGGTIAESEITSTQSAIEKIHEWVDSLWKELPIFSANWTKAETFDAEKALSLVKEVRDDLQRLSQMTIAVVTLPDLETRVNETKFLIAMLGRLAYARENYVRGNIEFDKRLGSGKESPSQTQALKIVTDDLKLVHELMEDIKKSAVQPKEFFAHLRYLSAILPGNLRTHVHDLSQVHADFNGGLTFDAMGVPAQRASLWKKLNITPFTAGYWEAHFIDPEEAAQWMGLGIVSHSTAAEWRRNGFTPQKAAEWVAKNFAPIAANIWKTAGFNAESAFKQIGEGYPNPIEAKSRLAA